MALRFSCPKCGYNLSAPEDCAGRSSKCRACGQPVTVPLPAAAAPITKRLRAWMFLAVGVGGALFFAVISWAIMRGVPAADALVMDENVKMVRRHPFWDSSVSGSEIDNILREMSAHSEGYLFVNSAGRFVYLPQNDPVGALIASDHSAVILWTANFVYPDVHSLGPKTVVIRRFPLSWAECARVLNDGISGITFAQALKQNEDNIKALDNMKVPDW